MKQKLESLLQAAVTALKNQAVLDAEVVARINIERVK
ncbi:MAG: hypothetical protein RLZ92_1963, partial [Pseudomonadota bacterium]